jgi:hypothetical protein
MLTRLTAGDGRVRTARGAARRKQARPEVEPQPPVAPRDEFAEPLNYVNQIRSPPLRPARAAVLGAARSLDSGLRLCPRQSLGRPTIRVVRLHGRQSP